MIIVSDFFEINHAPSKYSLLMYSELETLIASLVLKQMSLETNVYAFEVSLCVCEPSNPQIRKKKLISTCSGLSFRYKDRMTRPLSIFQASDHILSLQTWSGA